MKSKPKKTVKKKQKKSAITPVYQWTNGGDKVLIVKCLGPGGKVFGGFPWPRSGHVETPAAHDPAWGEKPSKWRDGWHPDKKCGGGLHGWPWGIGLGSGKEPDYAQDWVVFASAPSDVVAIEESESKSELKVKARCGEVVYCGNWWGALDLIGPGRTNWIQHAARGAASATGWRGAASATGWSGAASATGEYCQIEVGKFGAACTTARNCTWVVRTGASLLQNCTIDGNKPTTLFIPPDKYADGDTLTISDGKVTNVEKAKTYAAHA